MIEINNVSYSYGKIQALRGVSLIIEDGEIMSIIGANGAGKSTMMKCVAGLLRYDGSIRYRDEELGYGAYKTVRKGIALVPEGRWVFPNLSVEENLLIGGYTIENNRKRENLNRMFEYFPRLKERRNQRAGTLSGGEQQMLVMGRGLMSDPKVLLLDEPSLGLAPKIVNDIFKIIKEINEEGVTILLVEQNAKKALSIAKHACLLETGKIVLTGSGEELAGNQDIVNAYLGGRSKQRIVNGG